MGFQHIPTLADGDAYLPMSLWEHYTVFMLSIYFHVCHRATYPILRRMQGQTNYQPTTLPFLSPHSMFKCACVY